MSVRRLATTQHINAQEPASRLPKIIINDLAEDLLMHYAEKPLIDKYAVYQHLMGYWPRLCGMIAT